MGWLNSRRNQPSWRVLSSVAPRRRQPAGVTRGRPVPHSSRGRAAAGPARGPHVRSYGPRTGCGWRRLEGGGGFGRGAPVGPRQERAGVPGRPGSGSPGRRRERAGGGRHPVAGRGVPTPPPPVGVAPERCDRPAPARMRQERRQGSAGSPGAEAPRPGAGEGDPGRGRAGPPRPYGPEGGGTERGGRGGGHVRLPGERTGNGQLTFLAFSMASARFSTSGTHLS